LVAKFPDEMECGNLNSVHFKALYLGAEVKILDFSV
jgi:hypothetical protein